MSNKAKTTINLVKRIVLICFGAFLSALVINGLYLPNQLLSGGIAGIAMLLHLLLSWDTGLVTLLINIPIFVLGYILMDKKFVFFSMVGMLALSLSLNLTSGMPVISENIIVVIALGGAAYGFAIAIVALQHGSCGGNDIITRILHKYFAIPLGTSTLLINLSILGASIYFFGIDITIMTLLANFTYSSALNYFSEKRFAVKLMMVRSQAAPEMVTALSAFPEIQLISLVDQQQVPVLLIFVKPKALPKIRTALEALDPQAAISISSVDSVQSSTLRTGHLRS